jgi:CRP/FNR family transcriptional regulator, cyclic AMP receptor protein
MVADKLALLEKFPIFAGMPTLQIDWIKSRIHLHAYPAGVDMIVVGTSGEQVFLILEGLVKVYAPQLDGSEVILNLLGPGALVGEMSILDKSYRSASVITLEDTVAGWLSDDDFLDALQQFPKFSFNLLKILSTRLRLTNEHMQALASLEVHGRVAHQLLAFAEFYGQPVAEGIQIALKLPQGEIAELVGASRKRVNQAMGDLKREGKINFDSDRRVTILDEQALKDMCGKC